MNTLEKNRFAGYADMIWLKLGSIQVVGSNCSMVVTTALLLRAGRGAA